MAFLLVLWIVYFQVYNHQKKVQMNYYYPVLHPQSVIARVSKRRIDYFNSFSRYSVYFLYIYIHSLFHFHLSLSLLFLLCFECSLLCMYPLNNYNSLILLLDILHLRKCFHFYSDYFNSPLLLLLLHPISKTTSSIIFL